MGRYTNPASFFSSDDRLSLLPLQAGGDTSCCDMARDRYHHQHEQQQHPMLSTNGGHTSEGHTVKTPLSMPPSTAELPQPAIRTCKQAPAENAVNWH